jgi:Domain of unknown function (DUF4397)
MTRRILAGGVITVLVAVISVLGVQPAAAASGTYLRLAHLSPDTPTMDVLVTSFSGQTFRLDGVGYGAVSSYQRIEPGSYTVQMRLAGAPDSSPPVVSGSLQALEGAAYTAAGLGPRAGLSVRVLTDDLAPPDPGLARLRVIQGAAQAGEVTIGWNGTPQLTGIAFGAATDYVTVPSGSQSFEVTPTTGDPVRIPVQLAAGGVYSVVIVQRSGGTLTATVQTDAIGPAATPSGGIATGMGGTAAVLDQPVGARVALAFGVVGALGLAATLVAGVVGLLVLALAQRIRVRGRSRR